MGLEQCAARLPLMGIIGGVMRTLPPWGWEHQGTTYAEQLTSRATATSICSGFG